MTTSSIRSGGWSPSPVARCRSRPTDSIAARAARAGREPIELAYDLIAACTAAGTVGSPASHRPRLTHLAAATGGRVLAVDYRLAPERPFPAALDDAVAAYRHVIAEPDPDNVVVAGHSPVAGSPPRT